LKGGLKIFPWGDDRRYNSYNYRIREKFGRRIQKLSIDAGFTCPNRDGSLGIGGCSYCSGNNFVPSYCDPRKDIHQQIDEGIEFHKHRYRRATVYLAYLQAFSNSYAPVKELKKLYLHALSHPLIYGLSISTRPDCLNEEILNLLEEISLLYPVSLELGVESCYDKTLSLVNRGHDFHQSENAIFNASERKIPVSIHLLYGLPGESLQEMIDETDIISQLPITSVKFHQLQILKDTRIYNFYKENRDLFFPFTIDSYSEFIADVLERLNPSISVERFAAETPPRFEVVNGWNNIRAEEVGKKIESVMELRDTWQGIKFKKSI
jgi:radical SAM protein (TIGR01212 family)